MSRIRKVTLYVGPFKDLLGKGRAGAKVIESTGRSNEMRISFTVVKSLTGNPNESTIVVTNLSPATRELLREKHLAVELWGGYEDTEPQLIASGGIVYALSPRSEAVIETTIVIRDGWGKLLNSDYSRSFSNPEPLNSVIKDMASKIPAVSLGVIDVPGTLGEKGQVFAGNCRQTLDQLADQFKFSWSVQDSIFQAIDDSKAGGVVYNVDSVLLEVVPVLKTTHFEAYEFGMDVTTILDARIKPGDMIKFSPTVEKYLGKTVKVFDAVHNGSTHDTAWTSKFSSKTLF